MKTLKSNHILLLIILSILGHSCQTDDILEENLQENNVQQSLANFEAYHFMYMHYPSGIMFGTNNGITQIEYDNQNRPVKRTGGLLALPWSTGFSYIFSNDYYEEIVYGNNEISLTVKVALPNYTDFLKTIFKTENGKIIKKINLGGSANDTTEYYYSNEKIVKSIRKKNTPISESNYYYSNGNIDSIVTKPLKLNTVTQIWQVDPLSKIKTVESFKDFDSSVNPTKKMMLFEEIFHRSLSENNYRSYESKSFDIAGNVYDSSTRKWTFNYVNNQIKFTN